jgi:hypothetical protein
MAGIKIASGFQSTSPSTQAVTLGLPADAITFQPSGTTAGGTYATLALLEQATRGAANGVRGPKTVACDFSSVANTFSMTGNRDLGSNTTLRGLSNPATGVIPTLVVSGTIASLAGILDLRLFVEDTASDMLVTEPPIFEVSGFASIEQNATASSLCTINGRSSFFLRDGALMSGGTGGKFLVTVGATGSLTIYVDDYANLADGAVQNPSGGTCTVFASPTATIGSAILADPNINVIQVSAGFPSGFVVFQPGGAGGVNVFLTEGETQRAAQRILGPKPVYFDLAPGDTYAALGDLDFGDSPSLLGVFDQTTAFVPTFTTAFTLGTPLEIVDLQLACSFAGVVFPTTPTLLRLSGTAFVSCAAGTTLYEVNSNPTTLEMRGISFLGDGTNPVIHVLATGVLNVILFDSAGLNSVPWTIDEGGAVNILASPMAFIDPSIPGSSGISIIYQGQGNQVTYTPAVSANWSGTDPTSVANALDRIAAKITPIP